MATAKPARVAWGKVPVETDAQLRERSKITSADVAAAKAWVKSLTKSVLVVDVQAVGTPKRWLTASIYKQLWEARPF